MTDAVAAAERTLPHSLDAEQSILGAILVDHQVLDGIADRLTEAAFYRAAHRHIYRAILVLFQRNDPIDFVSVKEELQRAGMLDECGGPSYLAGLSSGTPRGVNVAYYASLVLQKASAREVIYLANRLLTHAYGDDGDTAALVDEAERGLLQISAAAVPGDLASADEMMRRIYPVIEALMQARRPVTGVTTGFAELDRYTRGLQPGNLIILGGRPSQGKSTLASQIALHVALSEPVAFFSVEMSEQEQSFRILATLAEVDGHALQCGQLSMYDQQRVGDAITEFGKFQFWLDESGTLSALQIRSRARRFKARVGRLGLIVVDYLQLLQHQKADSREQQVAQTGRLLKQLARELGVPLLALCQLSRAVEQRADARPKLSDLRESGSLEQDADLVLLIHRPAPKDEGGVKAIPPTELIIAKQRMGPTATIELKWLGEQYRFMEIES